MSKAPRNVLDIKRKLQLSKYLENNAGELRDLTIEQIATRAAADNGFPVTPANVVFLRDTFDLDIGKARQLPAPARDLAKEIDDIKAELALMAEALKRLNVPGFVKTGTIDEVTIQGFVDRASLQPVLV